MVTEVVLAEDLADVFGVVDKNFRAEDISSRPESFYQYRTGRLVTVHTNCLTSVSLSPASLTPCQTHRIASA